eukprot:TRINITY_DN6724_c0_g1_i1.p1 TRINITY_DN6724_c0_g1~~TRINITY_DN6724_c0_g1_i1.p1  ORF type:complete len:165 (+),score=54.05 TRINITY_DN6724_c0_g1_i1:74-568(+)
MIRRPPRSTLSSSSAASDVYKRQVLDNSCSWVNGKQVDIKVEQWLEVVPGAGAARELVDPFSVAVALKPTQHPDTTPELKIKLHALYKQAVHGPCNAERPKGFNLTGKSKWDAWHGLGDMGKQQAKEQFVREVNKLVYPESDAAKEEGEEEPTSPSQGAPSIDF